MPRVAVATMASYLPTDPDVDTPLLLPAFARAGIAADAVPWRSQADWAAYDLVLVRSTWDYPQHAGEFDAWLTRVASVTRLVNSPGTIRWNLDKRYLSDLAEAGIAVVPTVFHDDAAALGADLATRSGGVVVKPTVSAGSMDTGLFDAADPGAPTLGERILRRGGTVMLQPEVPELSEGAERSVYVIGGEPTHTIAKGALLERGGTLIGGVYQEHPEIVTATHAEAALAARTLEAVAAVTGEPAPLYARIDLVTSAQHGVVVLEAELIEPALNVNLAPHAAQAFVRAVAELLV
ncbi:ATP-grasp domain-containing protein [Serinibacter salmoneus]|nr:hypothetical protein [Serinibacter salmoneus]